MTIHDQEQIAPSDQALPDGQDLPDGGTTPEPQSAVRRAGAWVLARLLWAPSIAFVLLALRPTWHVPLQGDDFWLVFNIHANKELDVLKNSLDYMEGWAAAGTHFNPVAHFLDAYLKGEMMASQSAILTASALHHGVIIASSVGTLIAVAHLLSRLLCVATGVRLRAATVALPLSIGLLCTAQLTGTWSQFDPLLSHPVYGALPTMLGFAYLSASLRALMLQRGWFRTAAASALGVLGFLTYDGLIVFVAALVVIAWLYRAEWPGGIARLRWTLVWLVGPPLGMLAVGRAIVATHEVVYGGTSISLGSSIPAAWVASIQSSSPAALWSMAVPDVNMAVVGRYAIAAGLLAAAAFTAWALYVWSPRWRPGSEHLGTSEQPTPLRLLVPIAALAAFAPLPFVVTSQWSSFLLGPGRTYMHSLTLMWAWAAALAIVAVRILHARARAVVVSTVATGLVIWVALQVNINSQLAATLIEEPWFGVDVTSILETGGPDTEAERCDSLSEVKLIEGISGIWIPTLNRMYEDRFGVLYCSSLPLPE